MKPSLIVAGITITLLFTIAVVFGSLLVFRLAIFSSVIVVICLIWAWVSLRNIQIKTGNMPERIQADDEIIQEINVYNSSRWPRLNLHITAANPENQEAETIPLNLAGRAKYKWHSKIVFKKRGLVELPPIVLTASDPLGLFTFRRIFNEGSTVLIHPKTVSLPHFKFSSFNDIGTGRELRVPAYISANASGIREFSMGDSSSHIHWQSTLHTGKLMVKTFDADRSYNAAKFGWLLLDMQQSSHVGHKHNATDDLAVTITASIIREYLENGLKIGMISSDQQMLFTLPDRGERQLWHLLEKLALMNTTGEITLENMITKHFDKLKNNPLILIVATTLSTRIKEIVQILKKKSDTLVVILIDTVNKREYSSARETQRSLLLAGAQTYIIRKNDKISEALDNKNTNLHPVLL